MTTPGAIVIRPEQVVPIAREVASVAKQIGAVTCFGATLLAIAGIAMIATGERGTGMVPTGTGGKIAWFSIWVVVCGAAAWHFLKVAKRSAKIARLAAAGAGYAFFFDGSRITVEDLTGPIPNLSFKVSRRWCAILPEIPRATVVPPR